MDFRAVDTRMFERVEGSVPLNILANLFLQIIEWTSAYIQELNDKRNIHTDCRILVSERNAELLDACIQWTEEPWLPRRGPMEH